MLARSVLGCLPQVIHGASLTGPVPWIDVTAYGAKADYQRTTGCSMTGSSTTLTCGSVFVPQDVGKTITVVNGAAGPTDLFTTIAIYTSATQVTLATAAGPAGVSGTPVRWATDNTTALTNALGALQLTGGPSFSRTVAPEAITWQVILPHPAGLPV